MSNSELLRTVFEGLTLLIYFTGAIVGAVMFVVNRIGGVEKRLNLKISGVDKKIDDKHKENQEGLLALQTLVIRHDVMLNPEFSNGGGRHVKRPV